MNTKPSIKKLDDLGERFRNWKQNNPHQRVPKEFWNEALVLSDQYGRKAVAKVIGCAPSHIHHKQRKKQHIIAPEVAFVEIQQSQPTFDASQIQITIQNRNGVAVELSFQGGVEQIFPLISSLFKEGSPCSR